MQNEEEHTNKAVSSFAIQKEPTDFGGVYFNHYANFQNKYSYSHTFHFLSLTFV